MEIDMFFEKVKTVESKYRPIPFWSWNEKLDPDETERQIREMNAAGIGGFFMHARGGLQTKYMGEEWHENIRRSVDTAKELGMKPWVYDEDGWPSGFGGGIVNGMGEEYQLKYLHIEPEDGTSENTVCRAQGYHLYYEVNPFYVDTMDEKVIKLFLDTIYQPYVDTYGQEIEGFFTDEPQVSRYKMPWSFILPEKYEERYGDDLLPHLPELFYPIGEYKTTRFRFWKLITDLFAASYMKQVGDFCKRNGLKLTGHLLCEETLFSQTLCHGAAMAGYEYFDIPGMDWLGKTIKDCLTPLQVTSVAHQMGQRQILSETFAGCGHNVGHDELKGLFEWQMVCGVTLLCQHLEGYSLRGLRKRDYPPTLNYQQPWWNDYRVFNDTVSRTGKLLSEGEVEYDTLLIHPQSSAWLVFDGKENDDIKKLNDDFVALIGSLEAKHICFHLGDETVMERHARVEGNELVVGTQRYKTVILPRHEILFENTKKLLAEFKENGGRVLDGDADIAANDIIDAPKITYTERKFKDGTLRYFVNSTPCAVSANIKRGAIKLNAATGECESFDGHYDFAPFDSLILFDDGTPQVKREESAPRETLPVNGEWRVVSATENALTLDRCDLYFDGELVEENCYILSAMHKALALQKAVHVKMVFRVNAEYVPEKLYLVTETPQYYTFKCNGVEIDKKDLGYFADRSFRKLRLDGFSVGENIIEADIDFVQDPIVYEKMRKAYLFEVEKNRFTCDIELENFYLLGDFGVRLDAPIKDAPAKAVLRRECGEPMGALLTEGRFTLVEPSKSVDISRIESCGFPFFCGTITLEREFDAKANDLLKIAFLKQDVNVIRAEINGEQLGKVMWAPLEFDLSGKLRDGKNVLRLTLTNNLRNLLGPHHCGEDPMYTKPGTFQKDVSFWNLEPIYDDRYCFVKFGIFDK